MAIKTKKVFGVGLHKTGTSTLGDALLTLGYTVLGARLDLTEPLMRGDVSLAMNEASKFDALQDVPWAVLYKQLDEKFPGSKFVLTIRDEQQWIKSAVRHFQNLDIDLHAWIYGAGVISGNEDLYLNRYKRHNAEIIEYFKDRPNDLLVVNWENGDGWEELCSFLNEPVPIRKFPVSNKAYASMSWYEKILFDLKKRTPGIIRTSIKGLFGIQSRRNRFNNEQQNRNYYRKYINRI